MTAHERTLEITEALVRAYSRRGNYHSEASTSDALGLPGLVVQGVQAAGPAYGVLLDAWGEDFLAHGVVDMKFVGVVLANETVLASVDIAEANARFEVHDTTAGHVAVVGSAQRSETRH
jgi:acyl dehydratase